MLLHETLSQFLLNMYVHVVSDSVFKHIKCNSISHNQQPTNNQLCKTKNYNILSLASQSTFNITFQDLYTVPVSPLAKLPKG